jgi:WD40 repeat protein
MGPTDWPASTTVNPFNRGRSCARMEAMLCATRALVFGLSLLVGAVCCQTSPPVASAEAEAEAEAEAAVTPVAEAAAPGREPDDPDALPPGARLRLGTRALAHAERLRAVGWAGEHLVTASSRELRFWRADSGWELARIQTPIGLVAVASDGMTVATSPPETREVMLWRIGGATPASVVTAGQRHVTALAFSPDSAALAAASSVGQVRVFAAQDGTLVRELEAGRRWPGALAWSGSGERLAVGGGDGFVLIFELAEEGAPLVLEDAGQRVAALAFSSRGDLLAVGALGDPRVSVYDAVTGAPWAVLQGHQGGVTSLAFAPADELLVTLGLDRAVRRWHLDEATELEPVLRPWDPGGAVAYAPGFGSDPASVWPRLTLSPDGAELVAVGFGEAVVRASLLEAELDASPSPRTAITAVAFSEDGQRVLAGSEDGTVTVWRAATGELEHVLRGHRGAVVALSAEQDTLHSRSGWTERTWDLGSGRPESVAGGRFAALGAVAFDAAGRLVLADHSRVLVVDPRTGIEARVLETDSRAFVALATGASDDTLALGLSASSGDALFEVGSGRRRPAPVGLSDNRTVVLAADGSTLAALSRGGAVTVWRLGEEAPAARFSPARRVEHLALSPDGSWLAGGDRSDLTLWEVGGAAVRQPAFRGHVRALAWSADGSHVAVAGTHEVMSYSLVSGTASLRVSEDADAVALSSDGARVAALRTDGRVRVWRASGVGTLELELDTGAPPGQGMASASPRLAFSADDRMLAATGRFNQVSVFDLEARERVLRLGEGMVVPAGPPGRATSPDGRLEARVLAGGEIEVVELGGAAPALRTQLVGHGAPVTALAFSPDGRTLASGSSDTTVLLWPLDP